MAAGDVYSYYSDNGIDWNLGINIRNSTGISSTTNIQWVNSQFIIVGSSQPSQQEPKSNLLYSLDGISWSIIPNYTISNSDDTQMNGVAGNPKVGATIVPSAIHLNNNINSNTLTFSSESYYQSGVNNISINVNTI